MTRYRWTWPAILAMCGGTAQAQIQIQVQPVPVQPLPIKIRPLPIVLQPQIGVPPQAPLPPEEKKPELPATPVKEFTPEEFEAGRKKAFDLVKQLGDDKYKVREKAADELVELGRSAKEALLAGRKSGDPEVVERCGQILPMALLSDLKLRVDRYKADTDGKLKHDLPLLARYEKLFPPSPATRQIFSDILEAGGTSLVRLELDPESILPVYEQHYVEMCYQSNGRYGGVQRQPTRGEIGLVFLLGSDPGTQDEREDYTRLQAYPNFLHQAGPQFADQKTGPVMRHLFAMWLGNRSDRNILQNGINIVQQQNIKEALPSILKILKDNGNGAQPYSRAQALALYARMADKAEALKEVQTLLKDETVIQPNLNIGGKLGGSVQMRDVALAAAILLADKQPKDFGFVMLNNNIVMNLNTLNNYYQLGFADDEKRAESVKKFEAALKGKKPEEKKPEEKKPEAKTPALPTPEPRIEKPQPFIK